MFCEDRIELCSQLGLGWLGWACSEPMRGSGRTEHRLWVLHDVFRNTALRDMIREADDMFVIGIQLHKHHLCFYGQGLRCELYK